ncbi:MAG TPA: hypothetical protein VFE52_04090 [Devosia sp.]|jgi:hypothetical protein|nr:hypothetical protein [Devosia sp.]
MSRILQSAEEIRQWAEARGGNPMLMDVPTGTGADNTLLTISFGQHALDGDGGEGADRPVPGYQLVGWPEWLETLNSKGLALKVRDRTPGVLDNEFEFVSAAEGERENSAAAEQPATITTERPEQAREDRQR